MKQVQLSVLPLVTALGTALTSLAAIAAADSGQPPQVKEIIVVCKTHFDIGYTHRVNEVVDYYRTDHDRQGDGHHGHLKRPPA